MKLLKKLATDSMLVEMFPHLGDLARVCLSIPVGTASVEQGFSQIKMVKTRLRDCLGEQKLAHLMRMHNYCILIRAPLGEPSKKCSLENVNNGVQISSPQLLLSKRYSSEVAMNFHNRGFPMGDTQEYPCGYPP